jgi:hypothetical protein
MNSNKNSYNKAGKKNKANSDSCNTIVTETTFGTDLSQLSLARISFITNITIADGRQSLRITISLVVAIVWTISDCAIRARPSLIASASVIGRSCVTSPTEIAIALTRHIITRTDFNHTILSNPLGVTNAKTRNRIANSIITRIASNKCTIYPQLPAIIPCPSWKTITSWWVHL